MRGFFYLKGLGVVDPPYAKRYTTNFPPFNFNYLMLHLLVIAFIMEY